MKLTKLDQISLAVCAWKEGRKEVNGSNSMQPVINVIINRAKRNQTSAYHEIFKPLQFSSMSYQHDPQLLIQPTEDDTQYLIAQSLVVEILNDTLADLTSGALFYYALYIAEPTWAKTMTQTIVIGGQRFLK